KTFKHSDSLDLTESDDSRSYEIPNYPSHVREPPRRRRRFFTMKSSVIAKRLAGASWHPAWLALAVTFLLLLSAAAVRATPGVLFLPLEREFHWSRSTVSLAVSVNILLYGLVGPFAGALMQRLGVRRTTLTALTLLATGVSLATLVRQPWQLVLLWGVVVGS